MKETKKLKYKKINRQNGRSESLEELIISLKAAGHLSSRNMAVHLVVVTTGWHWSTVFEVQV